MKKIAAIIAAACILQACSTSPKACFDIAALNSNLLFGFAGPALHRQLAEPPEKLVDEKTYATAPMTRMELIHEKTTAIEKNFEKVKSLTMNTDNEAMIKASLALYQFVLPVYKKEYRELAQLYDSGAAKEQLTQKENEVTEKYSAGFELLYQQLLTAAKAYAGRHDIPLQEVNPVP
ncbi:MAG TPA: hypothetical protein PKC39_12220 [Ferruginibacter sp.]|nr:hypothetical protein [Ferruginibacter sp.]HMP21716.1 hypothetical protein [Ferruginibacter sp.]